MADYPLTLTASEIDVALQKSHSPDTDLTETALNDPSLATAGAIKNYVDTKVSQGASITVDSFAGSSLETSSDGLTVTNNAIPTSAAVTSYVAPFTFPNNRNIIKIFPIDFGATFFPGLLTSAYHHKNAAYDIPQGYKATKIVMYIYSYTHGSRFWIRLYQDNINSGTSTLVGNTGADQYRSPAGSVTIDVNPDVQASWSNSLRINFTTWSGNQYFYGGYIELSN